MSPSSDHGGGEPAAVEADTPMSSPGVDTPMSSPGDLNGWDHNGADTPTSSPCTPAAGAINASEVTTFPSDIVHADARTQSTSVKLAVVDNSCDIVVGDVTVPKSPGESGFKLAGSYLEGVALFGTPVEDDPEDDEGSSVAPPSGDQGAMNELSVDNTADGDNALDFGIGGAYFLSADTTPIDAEVTGFDVSDLDFANS